MTAEIENRFDSGDWQVVLPSGWTAVEEEQSVTLFHRDGVGTLQINTYEKSTPIDTDDLQALAQDCIEGDVELKRTTTGAFKGLTALLEEEETQELWRLWFVGAGNYALLISYNCALEDRSTEVSQLDQILGSLCLSH